MWLEPVLKGMSEGEFNEFIRMICETFHDCKDCPLWDAEDDKCGMYKKTDILVDILVKGVKGNA